ncbi:hypothetical protein L227DRAFT_655990 [Lentinus tigrinus ALCF2SS1-6]|uniref:Uncharacterized protein n=1 Tax=Lentinus tigrinus ALCF2SS1-6 TaxID=1328759 RepID=A0A5C2S024_9APHY|nr:hypothetical protein L227DRAFT_655990 [Lentinus tigrinus ALCF2SS1-6]
MSNNTSKAASPATSTPSSTPAPASKAPVNDAASFTSDTSTLNDAKDAKGDAAKGTTLGASSTSFAKKAKEHGWAAPTATRPSFG